MQWSDKQPIYKQIQDQIKMGIIDGDFKEQEAVPSIRQISTDYQVNPLTVSKAYQGLVDTKILEMRRGTGMFVKKGARQKLTEAAKKQFIEEEWPEILIKMKRLGIHIEELTT